MCCTNVTLGNKTVDNQKKIRREDEGIAPTLALIRGVLCYPIGLTPV